MQEKFKGIGENDIIWKKILNIKKNLPGNNNQNHVS